MPSGLILRQLNTVLGIGIEDAVTRSRSQYHTLKPSFDTCFSVRVKLTTRHATSLLHPAAITSRPPFQIPGLSVVKLHHHGSTDPDGLELWNYAITSTDGSGNRTSDGGHLPLRTIGSRIPKRANGSNVQSPLFFIVQKFKSSAFFGSRLGADGRCAGRSWRSQSLNLSLPELSYLLLYWYLELVNIQHCHQYQWLARLSKKLSC